MQVEVRTVGLQRLWVMVGSLNGTSGGVRAAGKLTLILHGELKHPWKTAFGSVFPCISMAGIPFPGLNFIFYRLLFW